MSSLLVRDSPSRHLHSKALLNDPSSPCEARDAPQEDLEVPREAPVFPSLGAILAEENAQDSLSVFTRYEANPRVQKLRSRLKINLHSSSGHDSPQSPPNIGRARQFPACRAQEEPSIGVGDDFWEGEFPDGGGVMMRDAGEEAWNSGDIGMGLCFAWLLARWWA